MTRILTIGIAVLDEIFPISTRLVPGEKHRAPRVCTVIGGTAANAALTIARLGGAVSLITRLGDDPTGTIIRNHLMVEGVDLSLTGTNPGRISSRSAIIIEPNGDRTIASAADPDMPTHPAWLLETLPPAVKAVLGDIRWEDGTYRLFTLARNAGLPAILDGDRAPFNRAIIDLSTHAVFSAQGLAELTGIADPASALAAFAPSRGGFYAVTDGAKGVFAWQDGALRHYPSFRITPVDTLGAGDVWHGAFALAIGEGQAIPEAIRFASAAAAIKCTRPGGGAGAPNRAELNAFLTEHAS